MSDRLRAVDGLGRVDFVGVGTAQVPFRFNRLVPGEYFCSEKERQRILYTIINTAHGVRPPRSRLERVGRVVDTGSKSGGLDSVRRDSSHLFADVSRQR